MQFDRVSFSTATTGTGTITAGAATSGFRTLAGATIADGTTVQYAIEDGTAWETGTGVTGASATTLTRVLSQSSTGALLSLSGAAKCFLTPIASQYNALSPGGATTTIQYNNAGALGGMSGTAWDDTNRALTLTGATITTSQPILNLSQTWNASGVVFTGYKINVTNTASATYSKLIDIQLGGATNFAVAKEGDVSFNYPGMTSGRRSWKLEATSVTDLKLRRWSDGFAAATSSIFTVNNSLGTDSFIFQCNSVNLETCPLYFASDTILTRKAAANLQFGAADAAAPVAQTLSVQGVVAGTSNTAGTNLTVAGSQGTGTGAGGSIVFQTAPAGTTGTAQNALVTALTIGPTGTATFGTNANNTITGGVNSLIINANSYAIVQLNGTNRWGWNGNVFTWVAGEQVGWTSATTDPTQPNDTILRRRAAANVNLGDVDAAAPVAQTLSVQSVVAGTSNTAGTNLTIAGSQGTGTGAGGSIIFQTAPAGSTGTAQNALVSALTIAPTGTVTVPGSFALAGNISAPAWTTAGLRIAQAAATLTDTSSTGTVALTYANSFGASTLAASSATTYTNAYGAYFADPVAGTNATLTNAWSLGTAGGIKLGGNIRMVGTGVDWVIATGSNLINFLANGVAGIFNINYSNNTVNLSNSAGSYTVNSDTILYRKAAANWQLGAADAAAPVAQTLSVQSVVAGTSNTAGTNLTVAGSQGTGTGAGGSIIFQQAAAGTTGTAQNPLSAVFTLNASNVQHTPTWNSAGTTYTGYLLNLTDTASAAASLLMDLQVGGVSKFKVDKTGLVTTPSDISSGGYISGVAGVYSGSGTVAGILGGVVKLGSNSSISWSSTTNWLLTADLILTRKAAANLQHGAADAAAPVAQTISVQSVVAGTTNTAGQNFTINGSQGTGTGAGGNILFQVAPAGTTGTAQNALTSVMTVRQDKTTVISAAFTVATLPAAGVQGRRAHVTDATAPTFLGALTGGGAVVTPVFDNGTAWVAG